MNTPSFKKWSSFLKIVFDDDRVLTFCVCSRVEICHHRVGRKEIQIKIRVVPPSVNRESLEVQREREKEREWFDKLKQIKEMVFARSWEKTGIANT